MSNLNRYYVKVKLTYEYEVIATSSEQAEEISRRRFDHTPNFTVIEYEEFTYFMTRYIIE